MSGGAVNDDLTYLLYFWVFTIISFYVAEWTRLSPLLFYLLFGCFLGNVEWVKQTPFMTSFGEFSIAIVFFALGFEENVGHFMMGIKKAWGIASIGAAVPFAVGFGFSMAFWPDMDIKAALMGGLAVTATAVSLTMIALKAEGLATSKPAIGIMTSAVLDDIASLALVAIMIPVATGDAEVTASGIAWILSKAVIFFAIIIFSHLVIFPHDVTTGCLSKIPIVREYGLKHVLSFNKGEQATLLSLSIGILFGMVAVALGFHPAIGTYMGGLIVEEHYFDLPDDEGNTYHSTLHHIENAAFSWLGPVFFLNLGASIIIEMDVLMDVLPYTLILYVGLFVGQFLSASFAARYVPGGFTWAEAAMIGFGMLGRAELFFVVLNLCYNDYSIIEKEMFFTFTFAAMLLNISVPIAITLYKPFYKRAKDAQKLAETEKLQSPIENAWIGEDERLPEEAEEPLDPSLQGTLVGEMVERKAFKRQLSKAHRTFDPNEDQRMSSKEPQPTRERRLSKCSVGSTTSRISVSVRRKSKDISLPEFREEDTDSRTE